MLYQIHKGFDGVQKIDQREIIYLVDSLEQLQALGKPFIFTDGHARHQLTRFFNDTKDLDQLDWPVQSSRILGQTTNNQTVNVKNERSAWFGAICRYYASSTYWFTTKP